MKRAWKHSSADNVIEVIVDPDFRGDLFALAGIHPIWVVNSDANRPRIDRIWFNERDLGLFEVNRRPVRSPEDALGNLLSILGDLDEQYGPYRGLIVHGLVAAQDVKDLLAEQGFKVTADSPNGFSAVMIPEVRGPLIGRDYRGAVPW